MLKPDTARFDQAKLHEPHTAVWQLILLVFEVIYDEAKGAVRPQTRRTEHHFICWANQHQFRNLILFFHLFLHLVHLLCILV